MVGDGSEWPLPSQSRRVRLFFYLHEGLIIGAGLALLLLDFAGAFLIDVETGSFNPALSAFGVFVLLLLLFFLLRFIAFIKASGGFSRDDPPEYQDWKETRQWRWVAVVAISTGGLLFGVSMFLWGWWSVVFLQDADLLMLGTILVGIVLRLYVLQRIGVKVI